MDLQIALFSLIPVILVFILLLKPKYKNLPPGPHPWPLIGNLPILFTNTEVPLHITLANMARTHGPIMILWLGTQPTVMASTAEAAMEILKTHDRIFSARHIRMSFRLKHHIKYSLVWSDCTDYWKLLRKIVRTEIFSPKMLQAQSHVREQKVAELIDFLRSKEGQVVKISQFVFGTLLNILGNVVFSKDVFVYGDETDKGGIQNLIREMLMIGAEPNVAEFYPSLEELDLQGLKKKCDERFIRVMKMWEGTVKERKANRNEESKDMLDVLLANDFNDAQINALFLETFGPGSETSSATIEWVIAELIKSPKEMAKVRKELNEVVGTSTIKESDLPQLPYLQACIKEAMRLHPAAPFLLPRRAAETCEVMGYTIPKNSQVLVNAYAIGRDPKSWKDPSTFWPERFLESDVDFHGAHYQFIPFGSGRRTCVGMPLATRTIPLIVGSLVHNYDFGLPGGNRPEDLKMNEMLSLTLAIDPSLCVVPKARA
uniref:Corytuberine synthase n=1 Tax=Coptis japonica TaxID=3442 RepID=C80G2_COPJA|nr:RecName: Full=Corytuberine synthase; AltName: Full=Cytochrome P450 80G2 [Coptis japonica]BAF80448.1 corytuberine synthase [Coptis japonica var. dissecta]